MAEGRWKLLRNAIFSGNRRTVIDETELSPVNRRTFGTFGLFLINAVTHIRDLSGRWYFYTYTSSADGSHPDIKAYIKLLNPAVSLEAMIGFNNTGNVCVWPAEEVLAYHCLQEKEIFNKANICELGCGMTGLAGIMLACSHAPSHVLLTDGNQASVKNVKDVVAANNEHFGATDVSCDLLVWNNLSIKEEYCGKFDYVLCADCLFFEHLHKELALTIKKLLKPNEGVALIFAPRRGDTLAHFCHVAEDYFKVERTYHYDSRVWEVHEQQLSGYNEDLHYPLKITLKNNQ